jgi:methionyl-tRNA formyltransferase
VRPRLRIAFFGTPDLAVPYLDALVAAGHRTRVVVTQPDRPAGRGRAVQPGAVKRAAQRLGLPLLQPESCRDESLHRALRESRAEMGVVVAYGNLLPCEVLDCPERGCVNVHYSLLPELRGAAPVQRALMAGMSETGVTLQWMSPELDAGDIIVAEAVAIDPDDNAATLFARLNGVGPRLLLDALALLARGEAPRTPQDEARVTWAPDLSKDDCHLDWTASAEQVRNVVRACAPRPGAFTLRGERRLKVLRAQVVAGRAPGGEGPPGTLAETTHDGHPVVHAGSGAVALTEVQPEGKQPMSGEEFARGARFSPGERLA